MRVDIVTMWFMKERKNQRCALYTNVLQELTKAVIPAINVEGPVGTLWWHPRML